MGVREYPCLLELCVYSCVHVFIRLFYSDRIASGWRRAEGRTLRNRHRHAKQAGKFEKLIESAHTPTLIHR